MKKKLKASLSEKRYRHSLGVAKAAKELAAKYGCDEEKAYIAGLLHDCAKGYSIEEQIALCKKLGVSLDNHTLNCPPVIHGFLGAKIAEKEYGISDTEILDAIRYHTVGRAEMTLLDKIIYIADMTEENRDFEDVEELRKTADKGLDEAILLSVEKQFKLQAKRRGTIHPNMIYMWNDILMERNEENGQN